MLMVLTVLDAPSPSAVGNIGTNQYLSPGDVASRSHTYRDPLTEFQDVKLEMWATVPGSKVFEHMPKVGSGAYCPRLSTPQGSIVE